ncbi:MAG: phenylalanine--tRNA ligase subunit beta [Bacteroidota bacterium]
MKISYNWLKEYIDFEYSPHELADALTMLGLEIGTVETVGGVPGNLEGVVVGKVESAIQHPNADRLRVCKVDVGAEELLNIVCGAPNVAAGQTVPVATVGSVLHPLGAEKPLKIKKGKIRGEVSMGMICAEDELGIGPDHDGIIVLEDGLPLGSPAIDALPIEQDYILEIDLTPNRIDGASHYGAARDLAALLRTKPKLPAISLDPKDLQTPNPIPVSILDKDRCKRYTSVYIKGVTVTDSPDWLKKRLISIGLRPINNIVDITNYVLHELGQPMHAFDADKLNGQEIIVKTLDQETPFITLDEIERTIIPHTDLMICDKEQPLCIAGTMGGINSGVTESTKNVFLECAYFDAGSVRKTAKRLGLSTDSSFRYERGADPHMTMTTTLRAASLMVEIAGGEASVVEDLQTVDAFPPFELSLSVAKTQRIIGKAISRAEIIEILQALEIEVEEEADQDLLALKVPPYRVDVQREIDVIEDILRVYGYNNVEIPNHLHGTLSFKQYKNVHRLKETYANYLSANGFYEILTNSLVATSWGDKHAVPIVNPLSEELGVLRQSMLPGALETLRFNQNRQNENLAIYEFGKTYRQKGEAYQENSYLAISLMGQQHPVHWDQKPPAHGLTTLKREVERLQHWFGIQGQLRECSHPEFNYGLEMLVRGKVLLRYGSVATQLSQQYDLKQEAFFLLIDWDQLTQIYFSSSPSFHPIPQYPSIRRDISMVLEDRISFAEINQLVSKANPGLIRSVELHDVYKGKGIEKGHKSYLISIEFRDDKKTLADKAVQKITERVYQLLENQLGAKIRS